MVGLLGVIAITGEWPVDAPRTHLETGGILAIPADNVARVDMASGAQRIEFSRGSGRSWLADQAAVDPAVAAHIDTAVRLLTVSAPRRSLSAKEYDPAQLRAYGLDPPHFVLDVTTSNGGTLHLGFGETTPAGNAQYVRIAGEPALYLLPRDVGEEWELARDMAGRAADLLLPISISQVWAVEIVSGGTLYRFERDPAGLWFHHVGQHVHTFGGFVHQADPKLAPLIEAELMGLDRLTILRLVSRHPDAVALDDAGLAHPPTILLLYSRDIAGPVARVEFGKTAGDRTDRYARVLRTDILAVAPDEAERHLAALVQLAGPGS